MQQNPEIPNHENINYKFSVQTFFNEVHELLKCNIEVSFKKMQGGIFVTERLVENK